MLTANLSPEAVTTAPLVLEPARHLPWPRLLLTPGRHRIGRSPDHALRIDVDGVAADHAMILVGSDRTIVRAWDRRTWLNDEPVREAVLRAGDRLTVGPCTWTVRAASADDLLAGWPAAKPQAMDAGVVEPPVVSEAALAPATVEIAEVATAAPEVAPEDEAAVEVQTAPPARRADVQHLLSELLDLRQDLERSRSTWQADTAEQQRRWQTETSDFARRQEALARAERSVEEARRTFESREQHLSDRETALATAEAELAQVRESLTAERGRLEQLSAEARQQAGEETARQAARWQAWQTQQQSLTAALEQQRRELEQRRTALEQDRQSIDAVRRELDETREKLQERERQLANEQARHDRELEEQRAALRQQAEQQLRQSELERQQAIADGRSQADQLRTSAEEEIQTLREQWQTELAGGQLELARRQSTFDAEAAQLERQRAQLSAETLQRGRAQSELIDARHELERERRLLSEQQAAWVQERGSQWQDLSDRRQRLDAELAALEGSRREVAELQTSLREQQQAAEDLRRTLHQQQAEATAAASLASQAGKASDKDDRARAAAYAAQLAELTERDAELIRRQTELADFESDLQQRESALLQRATDLQAEADAIEQQRSDWQREIADAEARHSAASDELHAGESALEAARAEHQRALSEVFDQRRRWSDQICQLQDMLLEIAAAQPLSPPVETPVPDSVRAEPAAEELVADEPDIQEPAAAVVEEEPVLSTAETTLPPVTIDEPETLEPPVADGEGHAAATQDAVSEPSSLHSAEERPAEPVFDEPPAEAPETNLRAELARMFNLPFVFSGREGAAETAASEPEPPAPTRAAPPRAEAPAETEHDSWRARLNQLLAGTSGSETPTPPAETPPAPAPPVETAPPAPAAAVKAPVEEPEEDSISAYMERLLRRTRGHSAELAVPAPVIAETPVRPLPEALATAESEVAADGEPASAVRAERKPVDRDATRAELQSFREVANLSARSALAKHSWKTTRTELIIQATLAVAALGGAVIYLAAPLWGGTRQLGAGVGFAVGGVFIAWRAWRTSRMLRQWLRLLEQEERKHQAGGDDASGAALSPAERSLLQIPDDRIDELVKPDAPPHHDDAENPA